MSFHGWFYLTQRYQLVLDFAYHLGFNLPLIYLSVALLGIALAYRRDKLHCASAFLITALVLIGDGLLLKRLIPFSFLITYERSSYADRLFELGAFFLIPFVAVTLHRFYKRLLTTQPIIVAAWMLLVASFYVTGLYLTYPRFDTYAYDRGYSTSSHDLKAVRAIDEQAKTPYIVLANQAVSAAALRELGFKAYYPGQGSVAGQQVFFYPIPTGGPLYQKYLAMVYQSPSRATALEAMNLAGVSEAYFVLNDYWFNAKGIAEAAQKIADSWQVIDGGKVYIFKYVRS